MLSKSSFELRVMNVSVVVMAYRYRIASAFVLSPLIVMVRKYSEERPEARLNSFVMVMVYHVCNRQQESTSGLKRSVYGGSCERGRQHDRNIPW